MIKIDECINYLRMRSTSGSFGLSLRTSPRKPILFPHLASSIFTAAFSRHRINYINSLILDLFDLRTKHFKMYELTLFLNLKNPVNGLISKHLTINIDDQKAYELKTGFSKSNNFPKSDIFKKNL